MDLNDYIDEMNEKFRKKETPDIIKKTVTEGNKALNTDWLKNLQRVPLINKYIHGYSEMNLYKRGWRFQFGDAQSWAGLCSAKDELGIHKSKLGKNIFVSIEITKHDANWETKMLETIHHEAAHAVVFEIFYFDEKNKGILLDIDPAHAQTMGHGKIWQAVCKAMYGLPCSMQYNSQKKDTAKPYKYTCPRCGFVEYGDFRLFAKNCKKCNTSIIVEGNIR